MNIDEIREEVAETGRMLLEKKLVARTWGNISERVDANSFACSPSGLDYMSTEAPDVAIVNINTLKWEGRRKPSSEKKIHAAAYSVFPDVNFVIHTHQNFASALSLGGFDNNMVSDETKELLGEVMTAGYALPGTKKLAGNVSAAFELGARVVLMEHHGVIICGKTRDEAFAMANALEEECKKQIRGVNPKKSVESQLGRITKPIPAQLDDMAQMIGSRLYITEKDEPSIKLGLRKHSVVIVRDTGLKATAEEREEAEALKMLAEKAVIAYLHTHALGNADKAKINIFECLLMRAVYVLKYSKKKRKA